MAQQQVCRVLARQLRDMVLRSTPLEWLPEQPVQTARSHSQYILSLLTALKVSWRPHALLVPPGTSSLHHSLSRPVHEAALHVHSQVVGCSAAEWGVPWSLQDVLGRVAQRVSGRAYQQVGRSLMLLVGELLVGMLLSEEVPAYNLYALFRLNDDVLALADFATRADITGMEVCRSCCAHTDGETLGSQRSMFCMKINVRLWTCLWFCELVAWMVFDLCVRVRRPN